jgi:hypothetical protein
MEMTAIEPMAHRPNWSPVNLSLLRTFDVRAALGPHEYQAGTIRQ